MKTEDIIEILTVQFQEQFPSFDGDAIRAIVTAKVQSIARLQGAVLLDEASHLVFETITTMVDCE